MAFRQPPQPPFCKKGLLDGSFSIVRTNTPTANVNGRLTCAYLAPLSFEHAVHLARAGCAKRLPNRWPLSRSGPLRGTHGLMGCVCRKLTAQLTNEVQDGSCEVSPNVGDDSRGQA